MAIAHDDVAGFFDEEGPEATANDGYPRATNEQLQRDAIREAHTEGLVQCMSADDFFAPESTANLVVPALGICPGPPTGIVGQAYVGKTILALSAGLAIALRRDLWGAWRAQQGPWLHLDYEQGRRHTKARIRRLARGFGVSDDELRGLIEDGTIRVAVHPELRLTTSKATDHYARTFEGVRFVTCDSLRPMLGGVDENSSQVRGLLGALSIASDRSGAAVALIHHAGKTPMEGDRSRKEMPRGSSGIVDEFQSLFVLTKKKGDAVTMVTHEKDRELGEPAADFGLRIDDVAASDEGADPKWGLRVVHVDREEMNANSDGAKARFERTKAAVLQCIKDNPGIAGAEAVVQTLGGTATPIRAAVKALLTDATVVERRAGGKGKGRRLFLAYCAPVEVD